MIAWKDRFKCLHQRCTDLLTGRHILKWQRTIVNIWQPWCLQSQVHPLCGSQWVDPWPFDILLDRSCHQASHVITWGVKQCGQEQRLEDTVSFWIAANLITMLAKQDPPAMSGLYIWNHWHNSSCTLKTITINLSNWGTLTSQQAPASFHHHTSKMPSQIWHHARLLSPQSWSPQRQLSGKFPWWY